MGAPHPALGLAPPGRGDPVGLALGAQLELVLGSQGQHAEHEPALLGAQVEVLRQISHSTCRLTFPTVSPGLRISASRTSYADLRMRTSSTRTLAARTSSTRTLAARATCSRASPARTFTDFIGLVMR